MPTFRITAPDGKTYEVTGPEGATAEQALAQVQAQISQPRSPNPFGPTADEGAAWGNEVASNVGNAVAGSVRGAGSIGATILAPVDVANDALAGKGLTLDANRQRRAAMDTALTDMGADTNSIPFQVGKVGTEIAGTAGIGGPLGNLVAKVPGVTPTVVQAVRTGGMSAPGANLVTRTVGGATNGMASAGLVDPDQALKGGAIGAALPGAAKVAGKVGEAVGAAFKGQGVSPEVMALADRAKQLGIDIPADRLVSSKPLDAIASGLNYVPLSGRAGTELRMNSQLNQALSKTFGQNSSNITLALRKADTDLGGKFDSFLRKNTVNIDQQFLTDLSDAANQASKELGDDTASIIQKQVDEIVAKGATGQIDGQAAYNIKKTLDRIGNRNSPEAWYALDLKKKLMGALERSVGPQEAAAFKQLRQQYGNMLDLQKIAKNGAEGEISVARLANMKNINNDELQELADIAAQFVKPRESQHGAMQRAVAGAVAAGSGGLPGFAALAGGGRTLNAALNSQTLKDLLTQPQLLRPQDVQRLSDLMRAAPVALTGQ